MQSLSPSDDGHFCFPRPQTMILLHSGTPLTCLRSVGVYGLEQGRTKINSKIFPYEKRKEKPKTWGALGGGGRK